MASTLSLRSTRLRSAASSAASSSTVIIRINRLLFSVQQLASAADAVSSTEGNLPASYPPDAVLATCGVEVMAHAYEDRGRCRFSKEQPVGVGQRRRIIHYPNGCGRDDVATRTSRSGQLLTASRLCSNEDIGAAATGGAR